MFRLLPTYIFKVAGSDSPVKTQRVKTAGRVTRQDRARQPTSRDSHFTSRSHKSTAIRLPDSPTQSTRWW